MMLSETVDSVLPPEPDVSRGARSEGGRSRSSSRAAALSESGCTATKPFFFMR